MISAGVIGWPVAHSKSPQIHRFWLAKLGLEGDYGRFPVHPDRLGDAIRALSAVGLRGVNVTVPHKVAVMAHLDAVTAEVAAIGAVNTIVVAPDGTTLGVNTDRYGVLAPLRDRGFRGSSATVLGAGGAARAVLHALTELGVDDITLVNRSAAKASALANDFSAVRTMRTLNGPYFVDPTDLLINSTSLGMIGQPALEVDLSALPATGVVFDLVYAPLETRLLGAARDRGLATIDGLAMLIGQAAVAFELFFDAPAPREFDADLRAILTAKPL